MEYAIARIIALGWVDIENLEEYPEKRLVFHFGDTFEDVSEGTFSKTTDKLCSIGKIFKDDVELFRSTFAREAMLADFDSKTAQIETLLTRSNVYVNGTDSILRDLQRTYGDSKN